MLRIARNVFFLFTLVTSNVYAQLDNVDQLLSGGVDDANLLLKAYLQPFGNGFGADLNSSWATTARTHEVLGFDFMISGNAAIAPVSDKFFDIEALGLQNLQVVSGNDTQTPSIVGDDEDGPEMAVVLDNPATGGQEEVGRFTLPGGVGFRAVPAPMIQLGVGVVWNTDVMVRFFPEVTVNDDVGRVKMFGFGIKHRLNDWFVGAPLPFDLAVMVGVTKFQAEADLEVEPDPDAVQTGASYDFQQVDVEATSFAFNILLSKRMGLVTFLGGVGVQSSSVDLKMEGTFPVTLIDSDPQSDTFGQEVIEDFEDPVNLSFTGANKVHMKLGLQLNLALFRLTASYTASKYPVASVGMGFTFR